MEYYSSSNPPQGELCVTGPSVTKGYFKQPEKTAEAFEGPWLRTGDIAEITPYGGIKIIDRAKNIFKLSQGEYIAPEKLENYYTQSKYILQTWVYGDPLKDYLLAFIVPDPDVVGKEYNEDELKATIYQDMLALAKVHGLNSLEIPKQIMLLKEPFSPENDILTPTMKLKRFNAKKVYQAEIDHLYTLSKLEHK